MSTAAEQFCVDHAGIGYDVVRTQIQAIDFHDCYPVVDGDGRLTGKCIPGDTDGYSLCDIGYNGTPRLHEHASEALIAIIEVTPSSPAKQQSFQTADELQKYIDVNGGDGLIVAVSGDGLSIAFGDENHSPTEAEFTPLRLLTEWDVDSVLSDRKDTDF